VASITREALGFDEILQLILRNSNIDLRMKFVAPLAQLRAPLVDFFEEIRENLALLFSGLHGVGRRPSNLVPKTKQADFGR
jgi:hypothetical protein